MLLENLLTWSRAQRQKITITPQKIAVHFIVEKCFGLLIQNAIQKEIRLKNLLPPETVIYADEEMITTIIRNLVSNAIKFTNRGGTITVAAKTENGEVTISVSDTGIGIPKDKITQLFHPDVNNSSPGTEGEQGTGLGLIICKDFAEKNKGEIRVESETGKGTVFYLSLPESCQK
jgi:two-component system, sensor histidine kinase and response regulator